MIPAVESEGDPKPKRGRTPLRLKIDDAGDVLSRIMRVGKPAEKRKTKKRKTR